MVTKKKAVKNTVKSPTITIWNQGKRVYQTQPETVINGGLIAEYSQGKKLVNIRPGEKCVVTREYGERMAKIYPEEIILMN